MSVEEELVGKVISINYDDLPSEVVLSCKKMVIDLIGAAIAGSNAPLVKKLLRVVKQWNGKPQSTVFLQNSAIPAHDAVLINSVMGRVVDFDALQISAASHPYPTMIPVALATAELGGKVTGKDFISAVVLGSEVMCQLRVVPDYCSGLGGWEGVICSVFGGAVTAGKIMNLSARHMTNALGLAYSQAAGNIQGIRDTGGGEALSIQQGLSARSAILSAILGKNGLQTSRRFLDAKAGFYEVYYRGIPYDLTRLHAFGQKYLTTDLAIKPYPCCGYTLCPIDNVLDIVRKNNLSSQEIDKIVIRVGQAAYDNTCQPRELKHRPKTVSDARFSIPYTVGSAIFHGGVFLEDFSLEAIKDAERLKEVDKVETILDPGIEEEAGRLNLRLSLNIVEVKTKSGKTFRQKMLYTRGFPQKPMTFEDCVEKARRCARAVGFSEDRLNRLVEAVSKLEQLEDVRMIARLMS